ncbi:enoyl-CoA hydratase/isomerase family protein [Neobacillus sp. 114]|uniref:enoyl-CoA hydratase/isomerase family protein n=1 Tax=Neobacillus sp. 114 TaxID=3048535 RepID=UPI0024C2BB7E|nr:enoyl-CoA hydratase/isomerase family protein [Neobacillus sp. 114]
MDNHLLFEREGQIGWIYLNNPAKLNSLDRGMLRGLIAHLESLWKGDEVGAIIITGSGNKSFATGMNVNEFIGLDPHGAHEMISEVGRVCELIRKLPVPVIAAINGYCMGAALEMTLAADIRLASTNAVFGMPEVKLGIPSVVDAVLLQQYVGLGLAKEMLLMAEPVSVQRINENGSMINKTVAPEELKDVAREYALKLISNPKETKAIQKRLMETWQNSFLDIAIQDSKNALAMSFATDIPGNRIKEFLQANKRKLEV